MICAACGNFDPEIDPDEDEAESYFICEECLEDER